MLLIAFITLALVLVGQVDAYPPYFILDDGEKLTEVLPVIEPFEMTNPSHVEGGELYQSDMLLSDEQWEAMRMRKAIDKEYARWTEGSDGNPLVPYIFLDSVNRGDVRAGLNHWMEHTCINFEETTNTDQPHLKFHIGSGCSSYVGRIPFKNSINSANILVEDRNGNYGQKVSIGENCNGLGTVAHEIGHAMGFYHEHSRSDRDSYINVLFDNVKDGEERNFNKTADNNYSILYDYSSVMHYGINYLSKNGLPTIVTLDPMAQELIGSRNGLSHRDKLLANRMYNCIVKWLQKCGIISNPCLNEGYIGKYCRCICPSGTTGSKCEKKHDEYYDSMRNPLSEKITTKKFILVDTTMDSGTKLVKWIVPPTCQKARLSFKYGDLYNDCHYQYLNVKTDSMDIVGHRMCAADIRAGVTLTSDTGIIITMNQRVDYGSRKKILWTADVSFEKIPWCFAN